VQSAFEFVARRSHGKPLRIRTILLFRRLAGREPFAGRPPILDGSAMRDPRFAALLSGEALGYWALGPRTLELVAAQVAAKAPRLILEFGSGVSTVLLAALARDLPDAVVVSIDQSPEFSAKTRELLRARDLDALVTLLTFPPRDQVIEGYSTNCYAIDETLAASLRGRPVDLVLIDGPAGSAGARFGTVPLVAEHLADGAALILDDAYRDGELEVADRWARLPYVRVDGIVPVEKGVLLARVDRATDRHADA
jgi:predicted O-methyltransferase YrrM